VTAGAEASPGSPADSSAGGHSGPPSTTWDSSLGRLLGALVKPGETFRSIAARPSWVAPLVLMALLTTGLGYLVASRIDFDPALRMQNEKSGGQLSAEQLDEKVETIKKVTPIIALAQGLIGTPAFYLFTALLFWVGFKLLGSELSYKASFATALHALLPTALAALLAIPVIWNRASFTPDEARSGSFLASNLASLAPEGTGRVASALLGSVDLFSIWAIILLVIGYRIVAKVSRAAAVGVVLAIWLLGVALKVGLAALAPG
jgi:hypothetical protein